MTLSEPIREQPLPHICVCICTYQRPAPLARLLGELFHQPTSGLFTYSIVVADNDSAQSAASVVNETRDSAPVPIKYCVEPNQGIALARNKVVANAEGDFLAFIDDDEFPSQLWLLTLFNACHEYKVDGVFGPVLGHFDQDPPAWVRPSGLYDRKINPTGTPVNWRSARTGNVFIKRSVVLDDAAPFNSKYIVGEDQDFFRRKIHAGFSFIWCAEAEVFEVVPPERIKRGYLIRRALQGGAIEPHVPTFGIRDVLKSVVAVPLYCLALPVALLLGQHRFMRLAVRLSYHLGKLLGLFGFNIAVKL